MGSQYRGSETVQPVDASSRGSLVLRRGLFYGSELSSDSALPDCKNRRIESRARNTGAAGFVHRDLDRCEQAEPRPHIQTIQGSSISEDTTAQSCQETRPALPGPLHPQAKGQRDAWQGEDSRQTEKQTWAAPQHRPNGAGRRFGELR